MAKSVIAERDYLPIFTIEITEQLHLKPGISIWIVTAL